MHELLQVFKSVDIYCRMFEDARMCVDCIWSNMKDFYSGCIYFQGAVMS